MSRLVGALALLVLAAVRPACADPFLDAVKSVTIGAGGGAGGPERVLGPPRGVGAFEGSLDTLSLGLGGSIVVAFEDNVVVDRPGPDFTVFENAFLVRGLVTYPPYAEPGTVSVSADGEHWTTFPCAVNEAPWYPGCAGVYPVFADAGDPLAPSPLEPSTAPITGLVDVPVDDFVAPAGSGGDMFDLAEVGLAAVRFVRIDASDRDRRLGGLSGFDLDAIAALHSVEAAGQPDDDGDGIVSAADDCPATPDPEQRDADGDGVGDACESDGPREPDADGDGTADAADPCPTDPACGPLVAGVFAGGGRGGAAEGLLTYVAPRGGRMALAPGEHGMRLVVSIAADVAPGSVELRVGCADHTRALGPFVPGSTRAVEIPVARRRTVVTVRARAARGPARRRDVDRFVIRAAP